MEVSYSTTSKGCHDSRVSGLPLKAPPIEEIVDKVRAVRGDRTAGMPAATEDPPAQTSAAPVVIHQNLSLMGPAIVLAIGMVAAATILVLGLR